MSDGSESEVEVSKLKLSHILDAFNAPIKFDHAWAIVYMVSLFTQSLLMSLEPLIILSLLEYCEHWK